MNSRQRNLLEANLAVLLWGGTSLFGKTIALPASYLVCFRSVISAAALLLFMRIVGSSFKLRQKADLWPLILFSLFQGLHWITYFKSIQLSTVAIALISVNTAPMFTTLLEPLFFRERLRLLDVALAVTIFLGVFILVPEFSLSSSTFQGILAGLASALFLTFRNLLNRVYIKHYAAMPLMLIQVIIIAAGLTPFLAMEKVDITAAMWGQIVLLGIVFTAIPHVLHTSSFSNLSARTVAVINSSLPIYGAVMAAIFIHEIPSMRTIVGGSILLTAVLIETLRSIKE